MNQSLPAKTLPPPETESRYEFWRSGSVRSGGCSGTNHEYRYYCPFMEQHVSIPFSLTASGETWRLTLHVLYFFVLQRASSSLLLIKATLNYYQEYYVRDLTFSHGLCLLASLQLTNPFPCSSLIPSLPRSVGRRCAWGGFHAVRSSLIFRTP